MQVRLAHVDSRANFWSRIRTNEMSGIKAAPARWLAAMLRASEAPASTQRNIILGSSESPSRARRGAPRQRPLPLSPRPACPLRPSVFAVVGVTALSYVQNAAFTRDSASMRPVCPARRFRVMSSPHAHHSTLRSRRSLVLQMATLSASAW